MSLVVTGSITTQNLNPTSGVPTPGSFVKLAVEGVTDEQIEDFDAVIVQVTGTYTGALTPQYSVDGTNWLAVSSSAVKNVATDAVAATISSAAVGGFRINIAGFRYFRISANAAVTGTAVVTLNATEAGAVVDLVGMLPTGTATIGAVNLGTGGTGATSLGKAEDAVAASGDTGVAVWGVRIPTTPASPTSAAGDYGSFAIDAEGKQVVIPYAGMEVSWQTPLTISNTTSTAIKNAAAAGIRNYLTDISISNTSATAVRVDILDNVTLLRSFWVEGGKTVTHAFSMPLRGSAATAMNVQASAAVTDLRIGGNGYIGI